MSARRLLVCSLVVLGASCVPRAETRPPAAADAAATSPESLFAHGQALFAGGDHDRAEQYMTLAVRAGYPEARAIVPLTRVCIAASRLRAALDHAVPFLRRHPDAWELRYLVAAIRLALGHVAEARTELERVIASQPEAAQPHYLLGVIERDAFRDEPAARKSFETYAALDPHGAFAPEVLAWLAEKPSKEAP
ncbi:MAG: tetratricopeptide repeat protein [Polyangiales bacterium]